jgi:hypothetical protein
MSGVEIVRRAREDLFVDLGRFFELTCLMKSCALGDRVRGVVVFFGRSLPSTGRSSVILLFAGS